MKTYKMLLINIFETYVISIEIMLILTINNDSIIIIRFFCSSHFLLTIIEG